MMLRHPLSRTEYYRNEDGTVRVVGKDGKEGNFTRLGVWISGERKTADPNMCRWMADGWLRGELKPHQHSMRPRLY